MKIIKVNGTIFSIESLNFHIDKCLYEVENMDIYSPVQTKSLGTVLSVDTEKLREKKNKAIAIVKIIYTCKRFISHNNIIRAAFLIQELNIKRKDLNYYSHDFFQAWIL